MCFLEALFQTIQTSHFAPPWSVYKHHVTGQKNHDMSVAFDNKRTTIRQDAPRPTMHTGLYAVTTNGKLTASIDEKAYPRLQEAFDAIPGVVMVSSGEYHGAAVCADGSLWTWGEFVDLPSPWHYNRTNDWLLVLIHRPLALGDHGVRAYHDPDDPSDAAIACRTPGKVPAELFEGEPVAMVSCASFSMLVLTTSGRVWSLGVRSVEEKRFAGMKIAMAADARDHALALDVDGGVWVWGFGNALGIADPPRRRIHQGLRNTQPHIEDPVLIPTGAFGGGVVTFVAVGHKRSAAVTTDGRLWTWGQSWAGPSVIDDLPTLMRTDLHGEERVNTVAIGEYQLLILTEGGNVYTLSDKLDLIFCRSKEAYRTVPGVWDEPIGPTGDWPDNWQTRNNVPMLVPPSMFQHKDVVACFVGVTNSAVVTSDGALYVWGSSMNTDVPIRMNTPPLKTRPLYIPRHRALAVAQATHHRLGAEAPRRMRDTPTDIIRKMCECHHLHR